MNVTVLGGGPAGLYCALLLKKADPARGVTVFERNAPDATYGWGVVFSDRTLASFQEADHKTYRAIRDTFVLWDAIDVYYHGQRLRCGGHVFAGLARKQLLAILQWRCAELGVVLRYNTEIPEPTQLLSGAADHHGAGVPEIGSVHDGAAIGDVDLLIAADGVNSLTRATFAEVFRPNLVPGRAKYIWLGTDKLLDAFTFMFRENEHGLFQVHAYPFDGTTGTFIVECAEDTWRRAGLDSADEAASIAFCQRLFADELNGARLYSNNSRWINFVTVKTATWRHGNVVLLGDAAHTAHFSIGSGTKLAMEDAIALANALDAQHDLAAALREYESVRRPVVETLQEAARESQSYFESVSRYADLAPVEFAFNLLTRSGRITYDDLRLRDPRFGAAVDRHFTSRSPESDGRPRLTPPPLLTPLRLRGIVLPNRAVATVTPAAGGEDQTPSVEAIRRQLEQYVYAGAGLVLVENVAVSEEGRITDQDAGLYTSAQRDVWSSIVSAVHTPPGAHIGAVLNHAGRRGAVRPAGAARGLDRPLREGGWPLVAASAIPYTPRSQTPRPLDRAGMRRLCDDFVRSACMADETGFDLLMLHMAHGYLLAGFLSPLANRRDDEFGSSLVNRMRFPLEVFDAVRAVWPEEKPLAVALLADDCSPGGYTVDDAIVVARTLKAHGCDLLQVLAGQTIPDDQQHYGRGHLIAYSDRIRNEAGIPTMVGGYLTTANEVNTALAGGRADLCIPHPYMLVTAPVPRRPSQ